MRTLKKLVDLLTQQERKNAALLVGMIFLMALLDVLGVASIMPFMAVLANPGLVETNAILAAAYKVAESFGISSIEHFLFLVGALMFVLLVLSLGFKALTIYAQVRFTIMREHSIGERLLKGYLHQPYTWFLNRNTADLGKTVLSEVGMVVGGGLMPLLNLISQSAIVVMLLALLLVVDPVLALVVGVVLGSAYILIFKLMSGFLARIGASRANANMARFSAVNEAFGAVKEVKVAGLERFYVSRFATPAKTYACSVASANAVAQVPRFLLEAVAFGGMILLVLFVMARSGGFAGALPTIALYAFAGYRLMPALQQIYGSFTQLRFVAPALDALHKDLVGLRFSAEGVAAVTMPLRSGIVLDNVTFSYPGAAKPTLNGMSLALPAHSTIGLVGSTGSGKTTLVDLVLGLLEPQQGALKVDEQVINAGNRRSWQQAIGYVPQQIFLVDDSVAANIAFGVEPDKVDHAAVERASKIANLHEFVISQLPQGYATKVGERGVRLSGGQRQRIGIARALYHSPQVLILDEATSALDNLTEQAVMEAIYSLQRKITIILIAHRLSTVRQCDQIFLIDNGQVVARGAYEDLCKSSEIFQRMTGANI